MSASPLGVDELEKDIDSHLRRLGEVFVVIDHRQPRYSGNVCWGVEIAGRRLFVKTAAHANGIAWLESAGRFHASVQHPAIAPLVASLPVAGGAMAKVFPWVEGEVLNDPHVPGAIPRDDERSTYRRFRGLPVDRILAALDMIFDAHLAVAAAGYVAVDFYDGCVMYDFTRHDIHLVDLDVYRPGPYVLDVDRQFGSTRFMAPEEFQRGATIDERTTVFTLARAAFVFLSEDMTGDPDRALWRASGDLYEVAARATQAAPEGRWPTVAEFLGEWRRAL